MSDEPKKKMHQTNWGKIVITGFLTAAGAGIWQGVSALGGFLYDMKQTQDAMLTQMEQVAAGQEDREDIWRDLAEKDKEIAVLREKVRNLESLAKAARRFSASPEAFDLVVPTVSEEMVEEYRLEQRTAP